MDMKDDGWAREDGVPRLALMTVDALGPRRGVGLHRRDRSKVHDAGLGIVSEDMMMMKESRSKPA